MQPNDLFRFDFRAMGSPCALTIAAPSLWQAEDAAASAEHEVLRIEAKYSRYRSDNVVSEINTAAREGRSIDLDNETAALLDFAFSCHEISNGAFDLTTGILRRAWNFQTGQSRPEIVPELLPLIGMDKLIWRKPSLAFTVPGMEVDFGGFGKEYAADRAVALLSGNPDISALVELGGDIALTGPLPGALPWTIRIRDPSNDTAEGKGIMVERGGVATSGDYVHAIVSQGERRSHILDPRTAEPVRGAPQSLTVIAKNCMTAGAAATIAMAKGADGLDWLTERNALFHARFEDGRITDRLGPTAPADLDAT